MFRGVYLPEKSSAPVRLLQPELQLQRCATPVGAARHGHWALREKGVCFTAASYALTKAVLSAQEGSTVLTLLSCPVPAKQAVAQVPRYSG